MAWDPTVPANAAALLSAPIRGNFAALDSTMMSPFTGWGTNALIYKSSTTALGAIAPVATGCVLISQGTGAAPIWSTSPSLTGLTLSSFPAGSILIAGVDGVITHDFSAFQYDVSNKSLFLSSSSGSVQLNTYPTQTGMVVNPVGGHIATFFADSSGNIGIYNNSIGAWNLKFDSTGYMSIRTALPGIRTVTFTAPDTAGPGFRYLICTN